jgi:hypothetical protein
MLKRISTGVLADPVANGVRPVGWVAPEGRPGTH